MSLPDSWRDGERAEPPYFSGVFDGAELEAWGHEDPFATTGWIDHCIEYARSLGLCRSGEVLGTTPRGSWARSVVRRLLGRAAPRHLRYAVALVRRIVAEAGSISILDVGGGFGDNFALLTRSLPQETARRIDYVVVDNGPSIELGRALYSARCAKPRFSIAVPEERFDLVLAVGTLLYVPRWREMCAALLAASRRHVFITRTPLALEAPTFLTIQSVCPAMGVFAGRQVGLARVVVINAAELNAFMTGHGWSLSHEDAFADYSPHFSRLPKPYDRGIVYTSLCWRAPQGW